MQGLVLQKDKERQHNERNNIRGVRRQCDQMARLILNIWPSIKFTQ